MLQNARVTAFTVSYLKEGGNITHPPKLGLKVWIIKKLVNIVIIQVNIDVQHIAFAIENLIYPMKSL